MQSPLPQYVSCLPVSGNANLAVALYSLLMANETSEYHAPRAQEYLVSLHRTAALLVMMHLGYKKHRKMRSPLIITFYRDGIVYFLALAGE